jgi:hypothetical protein
MRKIAIVGGGQSGLQLALGLLKNNYEVTVISDRTAEQIFNGRVTSSQFMFHDSLQNERDLGINFWKRECPLTEGLAFTIPGPDKTKALFWEAKLDHHGQSVDQRVKFAGWMNEFAKRGGDLAIKNAGPADIDEYSKTHDLVIVAAGKSEVKRMLDRDAKKSPYDQPKRVLALTYVKKMEPRTPFTGDKAFDGPWMQETFDIFWNYAQWVVSWTNSLLIPPAPQILQLMGAASQVPSLASRIANGFNNPPDYEPWWFDSGKRRR